MPSRLSRATRLLRVQDRMRQLAERELAVVERQVQAADTAQADLIRALNEASAFHEPLRATAIHRLKSLAVTAQEARSEREVRARQLLDRATQHKRTEQWVGRLEVEHQRDQEKRDWAERLNLLSSTAPEASLPPAKPGTAADDPDVSAVATRPAGPADRTSRGGPTHPDTNTP